MPVWVAAVVSSGSELEGSFVCAGGCGFMQFGFYWWTPVGGWHFSVQVGLRDLIVLYIVWKAFVWGLDDRVDEWRVFLDDLHFWHATGLTRTSHRRENTGTPSLVPASFGGAARGDSGEVPRP